MAHLARWYLALGVLAAVPAAAILGGGIGEWLRDRDAASTLVHLGSVAIILVVMAAWLFGTAAGLRSHLRSALLLAIGEAVLLVGLGATGLVGGGAALDALGIPQIFVLGALPLALGALLFGARLLGALRQAAAAASPFSTADLRAVGTLVAVAVAGGLLNSVVLGLA